MDKRINDYFFKSVKIFLIKKSGNENNKSLKLKLNSPMNSHDTPKKFSNFQEFLEMISKVKFD